MNHLLNIALTRPADFVIERNGVPYLSRWWVVPRNPTFNVYLHHILQDDMDGALHDHPWDNTTIVLKGGYIEHTTDGFHIRRAGDVIHRKAEDLHRLTVGTGEAWTLFLTGAWKRSWGFQCGERWVDWRDYVDASDHGKIGKGCGE